MRKLLILSICFSSTIVACAQAGEIAGKITDVTGQSISFAKVFLADSTGISIGKGATADLDGNYSLKLLLPGRYNLNYSAPGYLLHTLMDILVSADGSTWVDVRLSFDPNYTPKKKKGKK